MKPTTSFSRRHFLAGTTAALTVPLLPRTSLANAQLWDGARYAFLASSSQPKVAVIDVDQQRFETTLDLPFIASSIIASQEQDRLYVIDRLGKSVGVINLHDRSFLGTNLLGLTPDAAVINSADSHIAYAGREGILSVWDLQANREVRRMRNLPAMDNLTFSREGHALLSANSELMQVLAINLQLGEVVRQIDLPGTRGADVSAVSRTLDGLSGAVSLPQDDALIILNFQTLEVSKIIDVVAQPGRAYASGDGRHLLVPHHAGQAVSIISGPRFDRVDVVNVGYPVSEVVTGWLDTVAFALPAEGHEMAAIDLTTRKVVNRIELDATPAGGLVNADTRILVLPQKHADDVLLFETGAMAISQRIATNVPNPGPPIMAVDGTICH